MPPESDATGEPIADTLVYLGDAVKALDDAGKFGGYLVRFGDPESPDFSKFRDYFTKATDLGLDVADRLRVVYHHGLDPEIDDRVLCVGQLKADDAGVWLSGQLALRDNYEQKIWSMLKAGKLGFSSGTAIHLIRRERRANGSNEVKSWPLVEASLTPTPADPHLANAAMALKALMAETGAGYAPANPMACPKCKGALACKACDPTPGHTKSDDAGPAEWTGLTLTDHFDRTGVAVKTLADRLSSYAALKSADGHPIPAGRLAAMEQLRNAIGALVAAARSCDGATDDADLFETTARTLAETGRVLYGA